MAFLLDGQTQARAQMGVNVVCPGGPALERMGVIDMGRCFPYQGMDQP